MNLSPGQSFDTEVPRIERRKKPPARASSARRAKDEQIGFEGALKNHLAQSAHFQSILAPYDHGLMHGSALHRAHAIFATRFRIHEVFRPAFPECGFGVARARVIGTKASRHAISVCCEIQIIALDGGFAFPINASKECQAASAQWIAFSHALGGKEDLAGIAMHIGTFHREAAKSGAFQHAPVCIRVSPNHGGFEAAVLARARALDKQPRSALLRNQARDALFQFADLPLQGRLLESVLYECPCEQHGNEEDGAPSDEPDFVGEESPHRLHAATLPAARASLRCRPSMAGSSKEDQRTLAGLLATKLGAMVLVFLAGVVAARTLGAAGKGEVDVALSLCALLLLLVPSIEEPQLILLAREPERARQMATNGLILAFGFGAVVFAIYWWFLGSASAVIAWIMPRATTSTAPTEMFWLMLAAPCEILSRVLSSVLQSRRRMSQFMLVVLLRHAAVLVAMLMLVLGLGAGVRGAIQAWAMGAFVAAMCAAWYVASDGSLRAQPSGMNLRLMKLQVLGGIKAQGAMLAVSVILVGDQIILWHFHGASAVGVYALAAAITGQLRRLMVQPVKELLGSQVQHTTQDLGLLADAIALGVRRVVILLLPPSVLLAVLIIPFLRWIYGAEFVAAAEAAWVLLPGGLAWAVAVVLSWWYMGQNRFGVLTLTACGIAALNVGLNLLLIPAHGACAAAWTSTACYAAHAALFAWTFLRASGRSFAELCPSPREFRVLWMKPLAAVLGKAPR